MSIPLAMIIVPVVLAVAWVVIAEQLDRRHFGRVPVSSFNAVASPAAVRAPSILYHGTPSLQNGLDILQNNRWLIGACRDIFFTPDIRLASGYTQNGQGCIVEVMVTPGARLKQIHQDEYVAGIQDGTEGRYYRLKGLTPKRILDGHGINQVYP